MIGGWRLLGAAIVISIILLCQGLGWLCSSIYHVGLVNTAIALFWKAGEFPIITAVVGLVLVVPVFLLLLPVTRCFTGLLLIVWERIFGTPRKPGLITAAEIISRGYDPDDFDFEEIDGVIYGRRRGTYRSCSPRAPSRYGSAVRK
jgi:hypothetical protein